MATVKSGDACVYIGRSITRVIQQNTVYPCSKAEALLRPEVARAVQLYPDVAKLIVPASSVAEARRKLRTKGTLYNILNRNLMKNGGNES